jgi:hypothetical protein
LLLESLETSSAWNISPTGELRGTLDYTALDLTEGTYIVELTVNYPIGITLTDRVSILYAEPEPPIIEIIEPAPGSYSFDVAISGTVSVAPGLEQRISAVYASLDFVGEGSIIPVPRLDLDFAEGRFSGRLTENMLSRSGDYWLNVVVTDLQGDIWATESVRFSYEVPRALEIQLRTPASQSDISNPYLTVSGVVQFQAGYPVEEFTATVLQNNQVVRGPFDFVVLNGSFEAIISFDEVDTTPRLEDGTYVLRLNARDSRQRTARQEAVVSLARLKSPTLNLTANSGGNGVGLGGVYTADFTLDSRAVNPTLRGQINHQDGTTSQLSLALPNPILAAGSVSFDVADSLIKIGQNQIVVTLDDGYNPAVNATAIINFAQPVVTIAIPQNNAEIAGETVNVQFGVSYAGVNSNPSDAPIAQVSLNGALLPNKAPVVNPTTGLYQYSFSANELRDGSNTVDIQVADFRNQAVTGGAQVTFNYSRPTLTLNITEPAANSTRAYTGNVTFTYTSSSPLSRAVYIINNTEDANVDLTRLSSPYSYTIVGEDRLRAGQNTITIRATGANGALAEATRTFAYVIPSISNLRAVNADGNAHTTLMGDVALSFSSNVQLGAGQVFINNEPVLDLTLNDTTSPFEYSAILPGAAFRSGQNLVQVDASDTNKVSVSASVNANYLSARSTGSFTLGVGIGRGVINAERILGTLYGFSAGVNSSELTLSALFINGVRSEFAANSIEPSPRNSFNYGISTETIAKNLGDDISRVLNVTIYLGGGNGTTVSGETVVFAYRSPGGRYPDPSDRRNILHLSVDGHGQVSATTAGVNLFSGTGGGNQVFVGGAGANNYFFDSNSGADEVIVNAQAAATGSGSTVFSYSDVSMQDMAFHRIVGRDANDDGDLLITYGTGFPNPFSWQLVKDYANIQRAINRIDHFGGQSFIAPVGEIPPYEWTAWGNRDIPDGNGDFETISDWKAEGRMAETCEPVAIQARLVNTTQILWPGDINQDPGVESFDVKAGYICRNDTTNTCRDYEVRYLCPSRG